MTPLRESMERSRPAAEERWQAALAPDTVLASQLGDDPLAAAQLQPEKRLQLAVLVPVLTQPWTTGIGFGCLCVEVSPTDDAAHGFLRAVAAVGYICPTLQTDTDMFNLKERRQWVG